MAMSKHLVRNTVSLLVSASLLAFTLVPPGVRHAHDVVDGALSKCDHGAASAVPEVDRSDQGHIIVYRTPEQDLSDTELLPVRPGSIVVTPAATDNVMGHCFENAFAMLIAIPGFVAPYNMINDR